MPPRPRPLALNKPKLDEEIRDEGEDAVVVMNSGDEFKNAPLTKRGSIVGSPRLSSTANNSSTPNENNDDDDNNNNNDVDNSKGENEDANASVNTISSADLNAARRILLTEPLQRQDADLGKLQSLLGNMKFFSRLQPKVRRDLFKVMGYVGYRPGSTIFKTGAVADTYFVVLRGRIGILLEKTTEQGKTFTTRAACISEGEGFGELAIINNASRNGTAIAEKETSLATLSQQHYNAILKKIHMSQMTEQLDWLKRVRNACAKPPAARSEAELSLLQSTAHPANFFQNLSAANMRELSKHLGYCQVQAGETVFKKGDVADLMYVVLIGKVEILVEEGISVRMLGPKEEFGELAMVSDSTRTATVRCVETTHFLTLTREAFEPFFKKEELRKLMSKIKIAKKIFHILHEPKYQFKNAVVPVVRLFDFPSIMHPQTQLIQQGDLLRGQLWFVASGGLLASFSTTLYRIDNPNVKRKQEWVLCSFEAGDCVGLMELVSTFPFRTSFLTFRSSTETQLVSIHRRAWVRTPKKMRVEMFGRAVILLDRVKEQIESLLNDERDTGWIPCEAIRYPTLGSEANRAEESLQLSAISPTAAAGANANFDNLTFEAIPQAEAMTDAAAFFLQSPKNSSISHALNMQLDSLSSPVVASSSNNVASSTPRTNTLAVDTPKTSASTPKTPFSSSTPKPPSSKKKAAPPSLLTLLIRQNSNRLNSMRKSFNNMSMALGLTAAPTPDGDGAVDDSHGLKSKGRMARIVDSEGEDGIEEGKNNNFIVELSDLELSNVEPQPTVAAAAAVAEKKAAAAQKNMEEKFSRKGAVLPWMIDYLEKKKKEQPNSTNNDNKATTLLIKPSPPTSILGKKQPSFIHPLLREASIDKLIVSTSTTNNHINNGATILPPLMLAGGGEAAPSTKPLTALLFSTPGHSNTLAAVSSSVAVATVSMVKSTNTPLWKARELKPLSRSDSSQRMLAMKKKMQQHRMMSFSKHWEK